MPNDISNNAWQKGLISLPPRCHKVLKFMGGGGIKGEVKKKVD